MRTEEVAIGFEGQVTGQVEGGAAQGLVALERHHQHRGSGTHGLDRDIRPKVPRGEPKGGCHEFGPVAPPKDRWPLAHGEPHSAVGEPVERDGYLAGREQDVEHRRAIAAEPAGGEQRVKGGDRRMAGEGDLLRRREAAKRHRRAADCAHERRLGLVHFPGDGLHLRIGKRPGVEDHRAAVAGVRAGGERVDQQEG